jgi:hypothetical protein
MRMLAESMDNSNSVFGVWRDILGVIESNLSHLCLNILLEYGVVFSLKFAYELFLSDHWLRYI